MPKWILKVSKGTKEAVKERLKGKKLSTKKKRVKRIVKKKMLT
jgi:hypothetical protein